MLHLTRSALSSRVGALVAVLLVAAACSTAGSPSAPPASVVPSSAPAGSVSASSSASASGGVVTAKESEFKLELSATSAAAGSVTFQINNAGAVVHEFVVLKTDVAADKLSVDASTGAVSEETPGLTVVDEVEDIAVGASPSLTVDLPAGHYVLICNVPGHYAGGMHADFTTR